MTKSENDRTTLMFNKLWQQIFEITRSSNVIKYSCLDPQRIPDNVHNICKAEPELIFGG